MAETEHWGWTPSPPEKGGWGSHLLKPPPDYLLCVRYWYISNQHYLMINPVNRTSLCPWTCRREWIYIIDSVHYRQLRPLCVGGTQAFSILSTSGHRAPDILELLYLTCTCSKDFPLEGWIKSIMKRHFCFHEQQEHKRRLRWNHSVADEME